MGMVWRTWALWSHALDDDRTEPQQRQGGGVWAAVACLCLFSFTSFAEGTLRLLHCTPIEAGDEDDSGRALGHRRVLFYAGAVACDLQWQWWLYLILAMLIVI